MEFDNVTQAVAAWNAVVYEAERLEACLVSSFVIAWSDSNGISCERRAVKHQGLRESLKAGGVALNLTYRLLYPCTNVVLGH